MVNAHLIPSDDGCILVKQEKATDGARSGDYRM
jgi:hypothetical protein